MELLYRGLVEQSIMVPEENVKDTEPSPEEDGLTEVTSVDDDPSSSDDDQPYLGRFKDEDLLNGSVPATLRRLTLPMVMAMIAMIAFNIIDTIYIGRLGPEALAAITFTFPVVFFFGGLTTGLGIGATSAISRTIGKGEKDRARELTVDTLLLVVIITTVFLVICLATIDPIFRALGVEDEMMPLVRDYIVVWYGGMYFLIIPMVGNSIIRASGDTKSPMKIMVVAVVANIILDPLLIFGIGPFPRMELAGAAWATVFSRFLTLVFSLYVLGVQKKMLVWVKRTFQERMASWRLVLHVGAPMAVVNILTPVMQGVLTAMVAGHGLIAVAGYGAATRMELIVLMPIMAFCAVLIPFVGQNLGAGRMDRVKGAVSYGVVYLVYWGFIAFIVMAALSQYLGYIFNTSEAVVRSFQEYFYFAGVGFIMVGVAMMAPNVFNGLGNPMPAGVLTVIRLLVLTLLFAWIGSEISGLKGLYLGVGLANVVGGIMSLAWLYTSLSSKWKGKRAEVE